jgi:ADP-ribose pyrophosphatase YjhB (NUDIX family)
VPLLLDEDLSFLYWGNGGGMPRGGDSKIPHVGVGAIIARGREILLIKRQSAIGNQSWSTPGGYLEFEESFSTCASREASEEVGYTAQHFSFLAITNDIFEAHHFVTIWMVSAAQADWRVGSISEEVVEATWFGFDALPTLLFSPFYNLVAGISNPNTAFSRYFENEKDVMRR